MAASDPDGNPVGPDRSALEDRNLQHRADLDAPDQFDHGVHPRRLRAPRPVQLLSAATIRSRISVRSDLQQETVSQNRTLTNAGVRADVSYVKGIHNIKAGVTYEQTFLTEHDTFGIVDPTLNAVCLNADGTPDTNPAVTTPAQCTGTLQPNLGQDLGASSRSLVALI